MLCRFCPASPRGALGSVDRRHFWHVAHLIVYCSPVAFHLEGTKVFEAMRAADFEAWNKFESQTFSLGLWVWPIFG